MLNARHARTRFAHAKPASTARRVITGAVAAVTLATGGTLAYSHTADAATTSRYTSADAWLCKDATAWYQAGMPRDQVSRYWLAVDAAQADGNYRRYGMRLVVALDAGWHGAKATRRLIGACHPDW